MLYVMAFFTEEPPPVGDIEYDPDNLHVTVLGYTHLQNHQTETFIHTVTTQLKAGNHEPFPVTLSADVNYYGTECDIPVRQVITGTEELTSLNETIITAMNKVGLTLETPYVYSPHVSYAPAGGHVGTVKHLSFIHHTESFGVNVQNIHNIIL